MTVNKTYMSRDVVVGCAVRMCVGDTVAMCVCVCVCVCVCAQRELIEQL